MAIAPLRRGLPLDQPRERPPSPRETARSITTHPDRRSLHITQRPHRLIEHCPELKHAHDLVRRRAAMLNNRDAGSLPSWLDELSHSGLPPLPASPEPCAKTSTPSPRGSPPPTTPASTKAASPTSNSKNASWPDAPAFRSCATASS
ncbi:hypothetical protein [Streptomyces sp. WAC 01325]|uniref:hypothetical protein n=1 Tax=Streptomyces sp. WAC 01325 TaxID=2203202 RepID=UPI001C8DFB9B|nr:hypothetical protein [Streptomyces sp. WAC 01325]